MTDLGVSAVTLLLCSGVVGVQLVVDEALRLARVGVLRRLAEACERVRVRDQRTLEVYADAHGWARVFPLEIAGDLGGVEISITQVLGSEPRTVVAAEGGIRGSFLAEITPLLAGLPRARVVVAGSRARIEWSAPLVDPGALDVAIDALVSALRVRKEAGAYR